MAEIPRKASPRSRARQGIPSVSRAFALLEHFRAVRGPRSLTDLVTATGWPTSSVNDLLKTLSLDGYVAFDTASRTYFPTTRLAELGSWVTSDVVLPGPPFRSLKRLRKVTGETVLMGTPNELEVLYLAVLEAARPIQPVLSGRRTPRPLVQSGMGWALLSAQDDAFVERVYRRSVAKGLVTRAALPHATLASRLDEVRQRGFVHVTDVRNPAAAIIAAPVPATYQGMHIAIAVGGPTGRIGERAKRIASQLVKEIDALSGALEGNT